MFAGYLIPIFIQVIFGFIFFQQFHILAHGQRFERKTCCKMNIVCSCCGRQYCITAFFTAVWMKIGKSRKLYPGEKKCKQYHEAVIKHSLVTDVAQFMGSCRIVFSLHLRKRKYKLILTSWKMRFVFNLLQLKNAERTT